jgi:hypothetical protein
LGATFLNKLRAPHRGTTLGPLVCGANNSAVHFKLFESIGSKKPPPAASKRGNPGATIIYFGHPQLFGPGAAEISMRPPDSGAVGTSEWPPDPDPGGVGISKRPPDSGAIVTSKCSPDPGAVGTPGGVRTLEWAPDPGGYLGA